MITAPAHRAFRAAARIDGTRSIRVMRCRCLRQVPSRAGPGSERRTPAMSPTPPARTAPRTPEQRQVLRLRRFAMASSTYALGLVVLGLCWQLSLFPGPDAGRNRVVADTAVRCNRLNRLQCPCAASAPRRSRHRDAGGLRQRMERSSWQALHARFPTSVWRTASQRSYRQPRFQRSTFHHGGDYGGRPSDAQRPGLRGSAMPALRSNASYLDRACPLRLHLRRCRPRAGRAESNRDLVPIHHGGVAGSQHATAAR